MKYKIILDKDSSNHLIGSRCVGVLEVENSLSDTDLITLKVLFCNSLNVHISRLTIETE